MQPTMQPKNTTKNFFASSWSYFSLESEILYTCVLADENEYCPEYQVLSRLLSHRIYITAEE